MSVINKMLQELDLRHGSPSVGGTAVRPTRAGGESGGKGNEIFWRLLAFLMFASMVWVGVVTYQMQVQPVVTNLAFKAAEDASARRAPPPPVPVAAAPAVPEQSAAPAPASAEMLKLTPSIEIQTPPQPAPRAPVSPGSSAPVLRLATPQSPKPASAPAESTPIVGKVEKGRRPRTPQESAEAEFRRGAALLNDGRVGDAKEAFSVALKADQNHEAARQALIALLLDERQIDPARRLLQDGLAINPGNAVFAPSLARILIEAKEYDGALKALQGASAAGASSAEYQALAGAAYQRLGNHRQAVEAYRASLRIFQNSGSAWVGLAISLDALDHPLEASEAFQRALATETLTPDLRRFAEASLRRLK